ncbi:hypothetical protein BH18ACI2_BH18ACI2_00960 [soil metagenome]
MMCKCVKYRVVEIQGAKVPLNVMPNNLSEMLPSRSAGTQ